MKQHPSGESTVATPRLATLATAAALVGLGLTACIHFGAPERNEARARVTSTASAVPVRVITSTNFTSGVPAGPAGDTAGVQHQLTDADTSESSLPFDRTFDISTANRFFIRLEPVEGTSGTVNLKVWVDGELRSDKSGDLNDRPLEYVFLFFSAS